MTLFIGKLILLVAAIVFLKSLDSKKPISSREAWSPASKEREYPDALGQ